MPFVKHIFNDILHLFYPHVCFGCGSDLLEERNLLCLKCILELPHTGFALHADNPVERYFWGRLPLIAAHSEFYFTKESIIQNLVHQFKYKGMTSIGFYLGNLTANSLMKSGRFKHIDALVPLPLFADKERRRGYNQAEIICRGMAISLKLPVITGNVTRNRFTETQTRKHRIQRWENVEGSFFVNNPNALRGKHILLVDDVVTTGATLEACGQAILQVEGVKLSIATLALSAK